MKELNSDKQVKRLVNDLRKFDTNNLTEKQIEELRKAYYEFYTQI